MSQSQSAGVPDPQPNDHESFLSQLIRLIAKGVTQQRRYAAGIRNSDD